MVAGIFYGPAVVVSCHNEPLEVGTYVLEMSEHNVNNGMETTVASREMGTAANHKQGMVSVAVVHGELKVVVLDDRGTESEAVARHGLWAVVSGEQEMAIEEVVCGDTEVVARVEQGVLS